MRTLTLTLTLTLRRDGWWSACPEGVTHVAAGDASHYARWAMCRINATYVPTWAKRSNGTWSAGRQIVVKNCSFGLCDKTEYVRRRDARRRSQWQAEQMAEQQEPQVLPQVGRRGQSW